MTEHCSASILYQCIHGSQEQTTLTWHLVSERDHMGLALTALTQCPGKGLLQTQLGYFACHTAWAHIARANLLHECVVA